MIAYSRRWVIAPRLLISIGLTRCPSPMMKLKAVISHPRELFISGVKGAVVARCSGGYHRRLPQHSPPSKTVRNARHMIGELAQSGMESHLRNTEVRAHPFSTLSSGSGTSKPPFYPGSRRRKRIANCESAATATATTQYTLAIRLVVLPDLRLPSAAYI